MIIFFSDGRLGNQLFQYSFLKSTQKDNEKIVVFGFIDLIEVLEIYDVVNININNRLFRAILFRICKPILYFLADLKIISSIEINREVILNKYVRESATYNLTHGIFSIVTFVKQGFFQSELFFDVNIANTLKIKDKYFTCAIKQLSHIPVCSHKIFIHFRRTDYNDYTVYGKSVLLPMSYYKNQIEWFTQNRDNCFFIFISDDTKSLSIEFNYIKNKIVSSENHYGTDLAIMALCDSAILSPSSFGWWGSYMMKKRDIVFAPKYWLGFNTKIEYHSQGTPSYSKEIEI